MREETRGTTEEEKTLDKSNLETITTDREQLIAESRQLITSAGQVSTADALALVNLIQIQHLQITRLISSCDRVLDLLERSAAHP
jgi:hypothetical protein